MNEVASVDGLADPAVARVLDALHREARKDRRHALAVLPRFLVGRARGQSLMQALTPSMVRHMYLPVSRGDGRLLYSLARGTRARSIVEFGTSFGISTLYLAAAARDNGGRVITTEIEASKCRAATDNLRRAGLGDVVDVREGDALETLADVPAPVDLVFLDGWKNLYLPVLDRLLPALRSGSVVAADNVNFTDARPYLARVRGGADFTSAVLPGGRMELSWYLPVMDLP
jgi:predicted O-methyltransferase YrrM